MAYSVRFLPSALREFDSIVGYLAMFGPGAVDSFLMAWEGMLDGLKDGRVEHRLSRFETLARLGYRTVLVGGYVVLYYRQSGEAVIAHVFHQSQDYANLV
ncbi:MAG: type II toxin-antitoxin system RelE/ParE family toxin [Eggerthellaceae bacterium]